ncbi:SLC13 family permease [Staphylococcus arlettae]
MLANVSFSQLWIWITFLCLSFYIFLVLDLSYLGKVSIMIFILALILFVFSSLPAGLAGMLCLIGAVLLGVPDSILFESLNQHIVWLMIGAFIISSVIKESGLLTRLVNWFNRKCHSEKRASLFILMTIQIMTFLIPSTSSRAAAMLPIYQAIKTQFPKRATMYGLMIPILILTLTNTTLIGAGSHLIGIGILEGQTKQSISYIDFVLWGLPFGLIFSLVATLVLMYSPIKQQSMKETTNQSHAQINTKKVPLSNKERKAIILIALTIVLWVTESIHGFDIAFVTILMAFCMLLPQIGLITWKKALSEVSWSLIFFVASATALGELLIKYGVVQYLQDQILVLLKGLPVLPSIVFVIIISIISVGSHLLITSHTTRAVVLIPTVIIFAKTFELNPVSVVFITLIGINYCLTLPVSSKALLIFYELDDRPFNTSQLLKINLWLLPIYIVFMVLMYLFYWQFIGLKLK